MNDQLTLFFAKLFQLAWKAKKAGTIFSASSLGGRIRITLSENSQSRIIQNEAQLNHIISAGEQMDMQQNETTTQSSHETSTNHNNSHTSPGDSDKRPQHKKEFAHTRKQKRPLTSFVPSRQQNSHQRAQHQRYPASQQQQNNKRSHRHINSLDFKYQQPRDKRQYINQRSPEFDSEHRRNYQRKLRSFFKNTQQ